MAVSKSCSDLSRCIIQSNLRISFTGKWEEIITKNENKNWFVNKYLFMEEHKNTNEFDENKKSCAF